eukprot:scaffold10715_cov114-Isochrysis_galbana.AAC.2
MLFLPRHLRNDDEYRKQWIDNNLTYLDAELLEMYIDEDSEYMRFTWPEYRPHAHNARAARREHHRFTPDSHLSRRVLDCSVRLTWSVALRC